MAVENITAKLGKGEDAPSISFNFDFGDNLQDATTKHGEEAVFSRYHAAGVVDIQAFARGKMNASRSGEDHDGPVTLTSKQMQKFADEFKLGVKQRGRTPEEKARAALEGLSKEQIKALLAEL